MKKFHTLLLIAFIFITGAAGAQINKGATFLGGDLSAGGGKLKRDGTEMSNWSQFGISPVFGKAIRQNLIFGVDAVFDYRQNQATPTPVSKNYLYGLGAFLRKYGQLGKSGFSLFLQGRLGASHTRQKNGGITTTRTLTILLSAYPGVSYRVSRKLQLETGFNNLIALSYNRDKRTSGGVTPVKTVSNSFGVSTSLNNISTLYAGFRLLIN